MNLDDNDVSFWVHQLKQMYHHSGKDWKYERYLSANGARSIWEHCTFLSFGQPKIVLKIKSKKQPII